MYVDHQCKLVLLCLPLLADSDETCLIQAHPFTPSVAPVRPSAQLYIMITILSRLMAPSPTTPGPWSGLHPLHESARKPLQLSPPLEGCRCGPSRLDRGLQRCRVHGFSRNAWGTLFFWRLAERLLDDLPQGFKDLSVWVRRSTENPYCQRYVGLIV